MSRALSSHPIGRQTAPGGRGLAPQISFLVGHRGAQRLPHLMATLETIAAQKDAIVECIVVEQDTTSQLESCLPAWVRLIHTPPPVSDLPYCRSWSLNVAARHALAPVLVLHDNDMMIPTDYAAQILNRTEQGFEVINLTRFVFYLSQVHTEAIFRGHAGLLEAAPESIVQNLEGGGSLAITSSAFDRIGGMDESFIGWGGEDNELWERAQTVRSWPYGCMPLVHLWHAPQPGKHKRDSEATQHYKALAAIAPKVRIDRLRHVARGALSGPGCCR